MSQSAARVGSKWLGSMAKRLTSRAMTSLWDALLEEDTEIMPDIAAAGNIWAAASDHGQSTSQETDATSAAEPEPGEPLPRIIALPCLHIFHSACLVPWFSQPKQTTCPTC